MQSGTVRWSKRLQYFLRVSLDDRCKIFNAIDLSRQSFNDCAIIIKLEVFSLIKKLLLRLLLLINFVGNLGFNQLFGIDYEISPLLV